MVLPQEQIALLYRRKRSSSQVSSSVSSVLGASDVRWVQNDPAQFVFLRQTVGADFIHYMLIFFGKNLVANVQSLHVMFYGRRSCLLVCTWLFSWHPFDRTERIHWMGRLGVGVVSTGRNRTRGGCDVCCMKGGVAGWDREEAERSGVDEVECDVP